MKRCAVYSLDEREKPRTYKISPFLLRESELFKNYFETNEESEIYLKLFEPEFNILNSGQMICEEFKSVEEIDKLYDVLGYFGLDCLIRRLDEHVYYLEMMIIPDSVFNRDFFQKTRNIQICSNGKLSERFFDTHNDIINWRTLSCNLDMSEYFIGKYSEFIDWIILCRTRKIPESVIENNMLPINYNCLCMNTSIPEALFERLIQQGKIVDWYDLSGNEGLSDGFFEKYIDFVVWSELCKNRNISGEFFDKHIDSVLWQYLCRNDGLSEEFFERNIDSVIWTFLCENKNISEAFFESHFAQLDWYSLSANPGMSEAFFEKHLARVKWYNLSKNCNMSEAFFNKHKSQVQWRNVFYNEKISLEFLLKYVEPNDASPINRVVNLSDRKDKYKYNGWLKYANIV